MTNATQTRSPLSALADRVGFKAPRGQVFAYVGDNLFDCFLSAVGAEAFPSEANSERFLDAAEAVSAEYGVSVDEVARWRQTWADDLRAAGTPRA